MNEIKENKYHFCLNEKYQNEQIIALFTQTFFDSEGEEEGKVIGNLVKDLLTTTAKDELKVFVAAENEKLMGCILFTPLCFETGETAYLLSPVATLTQYQGKGVGQGLIKFGLNALKDQNISLVFTYGDPNFYAKVGFKQVTETEFTPPYPLSHPHGWLAQSLNDQSLPVIVGKSFCVAGLNNPAYW